MNRSELGRTLINGLFVLVGTIGIIHCRPPSTTDAQGENKSAQNCSASKDTAAIASLMAATGLDLAKTQDAIVKVMELSGVKGSLADVETGLAQMVTDAGTDSIASLDAWRRDVTAIADNKPFAEVPDALQAFKDSASADDDDNASTTLATLNAAVAALKSVSGVEIADTQVQIQRLKNLTVGTNADQTLTEAVDAVLAARNALKASTATLPLAITAIDNSLTAAGDTIAEQIDATLAAASDDSAESSAAISAIETAAGVTANGTVAAIDTLKTTTGLSSLGAINTAVATLKTTTGLADLTANNTAIDTLLNASGVSMSATTTAIGSLKTVTGGSTLSAAATAAVAARDALVSGGTTLAAATSAVNTALGSTGTTADRIDTIYDLMYATDSSSTAISSTALSAVSDATNVHNRLIAFLNLFTDENRADGTRNGYQVTLSGSAPQNFAQLAGLLTARNFQDQVTLANSGHCSNTFRNFVLPSEHSYLTVISNAMDNGMGGVVMTLQGENYSMPFTSSISNGSLFTLNSSSGKSLTMANWTGGAIHNQFSLITALNDFFTVGSRLEAGVACR